MRGSQRTRRSYKPSVPGLGAALSMGALLQIAPAGQCARADDSEEAGQAHSVPCSTVARSLPSFLAAARSETGLFRVDVFAQRTPLPVNQLVSLLLIIHGNRSPSDRFELAEVTADMPAHRHGMNTQPAIRPCALNPATGLTGFVVEGILLHMRGVWALQFMARGAAATDQAEVDIRL